MGARFMRDTYYVLRLDSVFRILYMDEDAVLGWKHAGWELRSYPTNAEAQAGLEKWKASACRNIALGMRGSVAGRLPC
jgi:hypothetical protein